MELALIIYLAHLMDILGCFIMFITVLGGVTVSILHLFVSLEMRDAEEKARWRSSLNKWTVSLCILTFIAILLPSKSTSYKMLAAYGVMEVADTERAQQLTGKSLEVLETAMDRYLETSPVGREESK